MSVKTIKHIIFVSAMMMSVSCGGDKVSERLDGLFSGLFPDDAPGAAVIVVRNGETVFDKGYGLARTDTGEKITDSTFFNICSVSKQFSSVALMLLSERGLLSLDGNILTYLFRTIKKN